MKLRLKNLIRRMVTEEECFSKLPPKMTYDEYCQLNSLGYQVMCNSVGRLDTSEGIVYYPLSPEVFKAKAIKDGIISE